MAKNDLDKKSLRELFADERRFRSLIEHSSDVISLIDSKGKLLYTSPSTERVLGYSTNQFIGANSFKFVHPKDLPRVMKTLSKLLIHPGKSEHIEIRIKHKSGKWIWVEVTGTNLLFNSNVKAIVANFRDITERKEREERQEFLQQINDKFSTSINHQITLSEIAKLIVPYLADYCRIAIVNEDNEIQEIVVNHENPKKISLTKDLYESYMTKPQMTHGVSSILEKGKAEIISVIDNKILETVKNYPEIEKIIKKIGLTSYMGVPLTARGKTIGAMTFSSIRKNKLYHEEDLEFAQEIARRIALNIDNNRLYQEAMREIEQRKEAEEDLLESNERIEDILESITHGFFAYDRKWRYAYLNSRAEKMIGKTRKEILGKSVWELFPELVGTETDEKFHQAMKKQKYIQYTFYSPVVKTWLESNLYPTPEGLTVYTTDITDRVKTEKTLKTSHDFLLHRSRQLETLSNANRNINKVLNIPVIMRTLVQSAEELTGSSCGTYGLVDDDKLIFTDSLRENKLFSLHAEFSRKEWSKLRVTSRGKYYISNNKKVDAFTMRIHVHSPVVNNLIYLPIHDRNGKLLACFELHNKKLKKSYSENDVRMLQGLAATASVAIENTLLFEKQKEQESRKDDFIAMASHELKTPLTSMKTYIEILRKKASEGQISNFGLFIDKIDDQTSKLTSLVAELLDISRIQTGKLQFKFEKIDLNELILDIIDAMREITHKHIFIIKGQLNNKVMADRYHLYQVVTNLLNNAMKYSPEGGEIIVDINEGEDEILIGVEDFGIGIAKEHQTKIFERLYQVSEPVEKTYPGLGIGLFISAEIIKRHNGRIWVESEKGKGSKFYFTLPKKI